MLRFVLEHAGMTVVSAYTYDIRDGRVDLDSFMRTHQPAVVVYDVAPPYEQNWQLCEHLRSRSGLDPEQFVVTSTNAPVVQKLAGTERVYEVIGKPYDLEQIVQAVQRASEANPGRRGGAGQRE
jgi:CheY-like chemotaxis protein